MTGWRSWPPISGRVVDESCHVMPMRSAGDGEGEPREAVAPCDRRSEEHDSFWTSCGGDVAQVGDSLHWPAEFGQQGGNGCPGVVIVTGEEHRWRRSQAVRIDHDGEQHGVECLDHAGAGQGALELLGEAAVRVAEVPGIPSAPRSVALATSTRILPSNSLRRALNRSSEVSPVSFSTASSRPSPPATGSSRRSRSSRSS